MVVSVSVATCRLDKLLSGPSAAQLCQLSDTLTILAADGSKTVQSGTVNVQNCGDGDLGWKGSTQSSSPWLSLVPDSGTTTPKGTLVQVQANPTGMPSGTYSDVVLIDGTNVSTHLAVPVKFIIQPCDTTGLVVNIERSGTLNGADCHTPHGSAGTFGQVFSFSGAQNEIVSIYVSGSFNGYVALDTILTKPPLAQATSCVGGTPGNPCIQYKTISAGLYLVEVTGLTAGDTGSFTVIVADPRNPNDPDPATLDQRLDATRPIPVGGTIGQDSVILQAVVSDPDLGDTLHLVAEYQQVGTNFSNNPNAFGIDTVLNGDTAHIVVKGLQNHVGYHWQLRAFDQTNHQSLNWVKFGNNSEASPDFSVSISQPPANVPSASLSQFHADDSVSSYGVGAVVPTDTIVLAGQVSDPDPGDQVRLLVEVKPVGTTFNGVATDSSDQYPGNGAGSFAKVRVGPLSNNQNYHWQAWAEDQTGRVSTSKTSFGSNGEGATDFRIQVAHPPDLPQALGQFQTDLTPLAVGDTANQGSVVFQATVSDTDGGNVSMNVEVQPIDSAFTGNQSGTSNPVPSGQVASLTLSSQLTNNKCYHWQARAVDNTSRNSNWQSFGNNPETSADFCVQLPVSQLVFTQQPPPSTQAGVNMTPVIQVTARNSLNQTVTSFSGPVTISFAANPGNGTLGGTLTQNAVGGTATFNDLHINKAASGYKLLASALSFTATSTSFNIVAGPVAQLAVTAQPTSAAANATITPAVQVSAWDAESNFVNTFTGPVTLAITPGTGNPLGVLTGGGPFNASAGIAMFSGLSIDKTGANYTLTASSGALTRDTSQAFSITGGPIASLTFVGGQPSTTTAGAAISPPVQVTALDAGNNVASFTGNIKVAIGASPSGDTVSGTTTVQASGGVSVFSNLHIRKAGNNYTLVASVPGNPAIPTATSAPFNIQTGAANQLIFSVQPTQTADSAIIDSVTGVKVTAYDSTGLNIATTFGNQVGIGITPGTGPGGVGLLGTTIATPSGGTATFGDLRIHKLGTGYGLTATASGVPPGTSTLFDIVVGPAKALFFTVEPPLQTVANVAMNPAVQVTARDAVGNKVIAFTNQVTLTITAGPGGANLSGGVQNAVAGVATFSNLSIDKAGANYALTASSGSLTQDVSNPFTILAGGPDGPHSSISPTSPITACKNSCAGGSLSTVTVTAHDIAGNSVAGATVTISSSSPSAVVTQPAGVTNSSGVATGTISDTTAGQQTVSATIQLNPNPPVSPTAATLTVNPSTPAAVFFIRNPLSTTAGATINNPGTGIQVQINDQFGNKNNVSNNVGLEVLIPPSPSGTLAGSPNPKAATNGVATFSNLSIALAGPNYFLRAFSAGLASDTSTPFNISPGAASKLGITTQPSANAQSGVAFPQQPAIQLLDANNNPVSQSGVTVTAGFFSGSGSLLVTTATTNGSGLATFVGLGITGTAGNYVLQFTATGLTAVNSNPITLTAGGASKLGITTQPSINAQSGIAFPQQPAIQLLDASNNPVSQSGVVVTAGFFSGSGSLLVTTATTNGSGLATFIGLGISGTVGSYVLQFTAPSLTSVNSNPINLAAGTASKLGFFTQPVATTGGVAIPTTVQVEIEDASGNRVTSASATIVMALGTNPKNGHLTGTTSVPTSSGVAGFSNLVIDSAATGYTLSATGGAFTGATSGMFNVGVGSATKLGFLVQPNNPTGGVSFSPNVQVEVRDAGGNRVTSVAPTSITLALNGGDAAASLLGANPVATSSGLASFSGLAVDSAASGYTLVATGGGFTQATSLPFNVTVGSATKLGFRIQPNNPTGGVPFSPDVQVEVRDAGGNRVTSASTSITLTLNGGDAAATLSGSNPVSANSGLATFTGLSVDSAATGYTLVATGGGFTQATSLPFNVTVGSATKLGFRIQPATNTGGGSTMATVQVEVRDAGGNRVTGGGNHNVTVAISTNPNFGTLSGTATIGTGATGLASFSTLSIDSAGTGYVIQATTNGLASANSNTFNIIVGPAAQLIYLVQPADPQTDGVTVTPPVEVIVADLGGNRVTSSTATIAIDFGNNPGGNPLGGTLSKAAVAGHVAFDDLVITGAFSGYTLVATSSGLTGTGASNPFTVNP